MANQYFREQLQRVVLYDKNTEWVEVSSGVPHAGLCDWTAFIYSTYMSMI